MKTRFWPSSLEGLVSYLPLRWQIGIIMLLLLVGVSISGCTAQLADGEVCMATDTKCQPSQPTQP